MVERHAERDGGMVDVRALGVIDQVASARLPPCRDEPVGFRQHRDLQLRRAATERLKQVVNRVISEKNNLAKTIAHV